MTEVPIRTPEQPSIPAPELSPAGPETLREQSTVVPAETSSAESTTVAMPVVTPVTPDTVHTGPSITSKQVEEILSEGLEDSYRMMDPAMQSEFRRTGEVAAASIAQLLLSTKVQTKKIIDLIVAWLKIIPGINKFFIEQEAKIKTDRLMALNRKHES
jgi:hypothetical protein